MRRGPNRKTWPRLAVACVVLASAPAARAEGPALNQAAPLEYAVKATYLYKFAPFISWRRGTTGPFQICIVGADPFGSVLDNTVAGQRVGRRPIVIRRIAAAAKGNGCHVIYFGGSPDQATADGLAAVRGDAVLTVTDAAHDSDVHGIIHFWVSGGRVRFEIDPTAASAAGLSISSKLLALNAKAPKGRS